MFLIIAARSKNFFPSMLSAVELVIDYPWHNLEPFRDFGFRSGQLLHAAALFVASHNHDRNSTPFDRPGMLDELHLSNVERNRVDDWLRLAPLRASHDKFEF